MAKIEKKQAVEGIVWSGIDEICKKMGGVASVSVINYRRDLGFPLKKDGGILICYESEVMTWAEDLGIADIRNIHHSEVFRLVCRRARSGPGQIIRGDVNAICEKLRVSTNVIYVAQGREDNPFRKVDGTVNEYSVDLNRWWDYVEDLMGSTVPVTENDRH